LTFIFTPSLTQSLPKLETLDISNCGELKHIIREEDGELKHIIREEDEKPGDSGIEEDGELKHIIREEDEKPGDSGIISLSPSL
jgi:hypothetical protein